MKKFLSVFCLALSVVVASSLQAENPPFLCSKAALMAECLMNVTGASIWIGGSGVASSSASTNGQWFEKSKGDYDCAELLGSISEQELSFEVARPNDQVSVYVGLYGKNGNQLLWGNKTGYLVYNEGTYSLPDYLTWMTVELSATVGISLDDPGTAQSVQINIRDGNGQITMSEWLPIENNGQLNLPTQYAGCHGELIINRYSDGQFWQEWYDLETGKLIPQNQVLARVYTWVKGYYGFGENPWVISFWLGEQADGTCDNPLVKFTVTDDGIMVPMSGRLYDYQGNQIDTAYAADYRKIGDSTWTEQMVEDGGQVLLTLPKGVYQAFLRFKQMKESNPAPTNWGGKG